MAAVLTRDLPSIEAFLIERSELADELPIEPLCRRAQSPGALGDLA